jgi:hypothetical protein
MWLSESRLKAVSLVLLLMILASFVLAVYAYYVGSTSTFDPLEALGSVLFWLPIAGFVFLYPLSYIVKLFARYVRTATGALVFVGYLSVHLLLYGILLEGIIVYAEKIPPIFSQGAASFSALLAYPESLVTIIDDYLINPSLNIAIPPDYNLALSLFSFVIALITAILVVSNIMKVKELSRSCTLAQKSRAFVALPALGVVGGAICCLSLPALISLVAPATTAVVSGSIVAYYVAYLIPVATDVALKYNVDSTIKIASKISTVTA